jgi:hypothetical protein
MPIPEGAHKPVGPRAVAELIQPEDPRWLEALARAPHDFYHLPQYAIVSAKHEGGQPAAFYAESNGTVFLAPVLLRPLPAMLGAPPEWCDAVCPYGYAGPIVGGRGDSADLADCLELSRTRASAEGVIAAFFRLHPLIELDLEVLARFGEVVTLGQVVPIDLTQPEEVLWKQVRANHRSDISRLRRAGFQPRLDDWEQLDQFIDIYRATMARVSARDFYFFTREYFDDLSAALAGGLHLCTVVSDDGTVAAGGLFVAMNGIVQYHLSGTAEQFLAQAPTKLMLDFMRSWAKSSGHRVLHLGGGVGGRADSLFTFKARFSATTVACRAYRMIVNPDRYAILMARWREQGGTDGGGDGEFFPGYRRPTSPSAPDLSPDPVSLEEHGPS